MANMLPGMLKLPPSVEAHVSYSYINLFMCTCARTCINTHTLVYKHTYVYVYLHTLAQTHKYMDARERRKSNGNPTRAGATAHLKKSCVHTCSTRTEHAKPVCDAERDHSLESGVRGRPCGRCEDASKGRLRYRLPG